MRRHEIMMPDGPDYRQEIDGRTRHVYQRRLYRGYWISYSPPPAPTKLVWSFVHDDYDLGDPRHGDGESVVDCCGRIDELEDELAQEARESGVQ